MRLRCMCYAFVSTFGLKWLVSCACVNDCVSDVNHYTKWPRSERKHIHNANVQRSHYNTTELNQFTNATQIHHKRVKGADPLLSPYNVSCHQFDGQIDLNLHPNIEKAE